MNGFNIRTHIMSLIGGGTGSARSNGGDIMPIEVAIAGTKIAQDCSHVVERTLHLDLMMPLQARTNVCANNDDCFQKHIFKSKYLVLLYGAHNVEY